MKAHYKAVCFAILLLPRFAAPQLSPASAATTTEQQTNSQPPQPLNLGTGVVRLRHPLEWKPPKYPKHALQSKLQGSVVLNLTLDRKGRVTGIAVLSGDSELAHASAGAVRKWKYAPSSNDGPSEITVTLTIDFKINDAGLPQVMAKYTDPVTGNFLTLNGNLKPPAILYSSDPAYTKEARQAKLQGTCVLSLILGPDGIPRDIRVARSLDKGLDAQAIEAVQHWRFAPAVSDGVPVAVKINVEVQFRL